jgi:hypothetical protein
MLNFAALVSIIKTILKTREHSNQMNKLCLVFIILASVFVSIKAQEVVTDLNGFRIGQYRETASNAFGKPFKQEKLADNWEHEAFIVNEDNGVYMIFQYHPKQNDLIWSIQITGDDPLLNFGFKNLRFGIDKSAVGKILGKPERKVDIGEYGNRWNYDKTNYSIEISAKGKLSSIKIHNNYLDETPDIKKRPIFKDVIKTLQTGKNSEIAELLSPGMEIYYKKQTLFFNKSWKNEIETDFSHVFAAIKELAVGLEKINTSDINVYEENMRFTMGQNPKHVVKIKSGHIIKEIVFQFSNGKFRIWEVITEPLSAETSPKTMAIRTRNSELANSNKK